MIDDVRKEVCLLLCNDDSGHDMEHINRVYRMSLDFSSNLDVDKYVVSLIALLHDVDDYKLFGLESSLNLTNAKTIMNKVNINKETQDKVLSSLSCIGYSKRLKGIIPGSLEGMIVSDADMCDALGVSGVLRAYKYSIKYNQTFFDRDIFPNDNLTAEDYASRKTNSCICHVFEKILRLKDLMLTESGRKEALKRHKMVIDILYNFFEEENALEWIKYLDEYLKK